MGRPKKKQTNQEQTNQEQTNQEQTNQNTEQVSSTFSNESSEDLTEKIKSLKEEHDLDKAVEQGKKERKKKTANYSYRSKKVIEEEKRQFSESIQGVGSFAMNLICERLPNPKPLSPEEAKNFDYLFGKVIFKYSEMLGNYQEETALFSVALMIVIPRLNKPKELKENEK